MKQSHGFTGGDSQDRPRNKWRGRKTWTVIEELLGIWYGQFWELKCPKGPNHRGIFTILWELPGAPTASVGGKCPHASSRGSEKGARALHKPSISLSKTWWRETSQPEPHLLEEDQSLMMSVKRNAPLQPPLAFQVREGKHPNTIHSSHPVWSKEGETLSNVCGTHRPEVQAHYSTRT